MLTPGNSGIRARNRSSVHDSHLFKNAVVCVHVNQDSVAIVIITFIRLLLITVVAFPYLLGFIDN